MKKLLNMTFFGSAIAGGRTWYFTIILLVIQPQSISSAPTADPTLNQSRLLNVINPTKPEKSFNDENDKTLYKISEISTSADLARFNRVVQYAREEKLHERSMGEIIQAIANYFIGTPYKAGLLDKSIDEKLVVSLDGFDCVLFVETVLAIARGVAVQDYAYSTFVEHIENQRYANGKINGYCSRLHYFSEWIADNEKRSAVQNITGKLGGIPLNKKLNFMSRHREVYPQLTNNESNYKCIVEQETKLAELTVNYIPQNQIKSLYSQLQPGDIVAVATNIEGLDVTHTGLVYRNADGNLGLIHASPIGEVTISYDLHRYIGRAENAIGIIVARPIDPRQPD